MTIPGRFYFLKKPPEMMALAPKKYIYLRKKIPVFHKTLLTPLRLLLYALRHPGGKYGGHSGKMCGRI